MSTRVMVMPWLANHAWARSQNLGGGVFAFVGEQLGVGQPGVIIECGVQVVITDDGVAIDPGCRGGPRVAPALGSSLDSPPAAIRNLAEFLHVQVHQITGPGVLVTADHPTRRAVQPAQTGQAVAGQHAVHRRGVQPKQVADPGRPPPSGHPDLDDPPLGAGRGALRRTMRP